MHWPVWLSSAEIIMYNADSSAHWLYSGAECGGCVRVLPLTDLLIICMQASIQLDGRVGGVAMQGLPQVSSGGTVTSVGPKYHLCACASGRLFLVPANSLRCAAANEMTNPCS